MKKVFLHCLLVVICYSLLLLCVPQVIFAKVVINEFYSVGSDDWVELYNDGADSVNLSSYRLRDNSVSNKVDLSGNISAGGFISYDWSNKLNKDEDTVKLVLSADDSLIDQISYGDGATVLAPGEGQSGGRSPNGSANWVVFTSPTKGLSNNAAPIAPTFTPTPSPTSKPDPTNTPTPTPKATATPKPTATLTPSPTGSLTPTKSTSYPTPKANAGKLSTSNGTYPTAVLAAQTTAEPTKKESKPTPTPEIKPSDFAHTPLQQVFMGGMAILGLIILGFGGYLYKQSQNSL